MIKALQLAKRIDDTLFSSSEIKKQFSEVFEGLGTLGEEYTICLKEHAKLHALFTPQNVPLPLREKV